MKMTPVYSIQAIITFIFLLFSSPVISQKLPNVQQGGKRVRANVIIDAKATEWDGKFMAYNKATEIFYTIANDDAYLYLTVKATDIDIINKIIKGGLTFTINTSERKDDKNGIAITFPVFDKMDGFNINLNNKPKRIRDTVQNSRLLDSFMRVVNREVTRTSREIKIIGVKEIPDNSVSVYNDLGIKAKSLFDKEIGYTYELAMPLKYLGLSVADSKTFFYNIRINPQNITQVSRDLRSGLTSIYLVNGSMVYEGPTADKVQYLMSATDFWGDYRLEK